MEVSLKTEKGQHLIIIDGKEHVPLAFRSFRPNAKNIKEFYNAGVRLMSIFPTGLWCSLDVPYSLFGEVWNGIGQYNYSNLDSQIELFLENAPEAYFNVMLHLDTRDWYLQENPECSDTYWNLIDMAGNQKWRTDTVEFLTAMVKYIENKYGDRVFAYSLFCGTTCEWFTNWQGEGKIDMEVAPHPVKMEAYREYMKDDQIQLPTLEILKQTADGVFRDPQINSEALDYWRFHHGIIADTILYFAKQFQDIVEHKKLLGLFFGYLLELTDQRLLHEGHLGYERVWNSTDIDMFYAPSPYGFPRTSQGASGFMLTVDSLILKDKLYFHEVDHTTHIAPTRLENGREIRRGEWIPKNEYESIMMLRREFVMSAAKGVGLWWFDFFGGYYDSPGLMKAVSGMVDIRKRLKDVQMYSISQVAVFGDTESMYYVSGNAEINTDCLRNTRNGLNKLGAPYDVFTFNDITDPSLDLDQYKLIIFLNVFHVADDKKEFIRNVVKSRNRLILWIYAPGYVQKNGLSAEGISELTEISVKRLECSESHIKVNNVGPFEGLGKVLRYGFTKTINPLFYMDDTEAEVLGVFERSNYPGLGYKKLNTYTSFYSTMGNIPSCLLREIARFAGVHIFCESGNPVYINNRIIGICSMVDGPVTVRLPYDIEVRELFDGGNYRSRDGCLQLDLTRGEVKMYLIENGSIMKS